MSRMIWTKQIAVAVFFLLILVSQGFCQTTAPSDQREPYQVLVTATQKLLATANKLDAWPLEDYVGVIELAYYSLGSSPGKSEAGDGPMITQIADLTQQLLRRIPPAEREKNERTKKLVARVLLLKVLLSDGQFASVEQDILELQRIDPGNAITWLATAELAWQRGQFGMCIRLCNKALEQDAFSLYDKDFRQRVFAACESARVSDNTLATALVRIIYPWREVAMFVRQAAMLEFLGPLEKLTTGESTAPPHAGIVYLACVAVDRPLGFGFDVSVTAGSLASATLTGVSREIEVQLKEQRTILIKEAVEVERLALPETKDKLAVYLAGKGRIRVLAADGSVADCLSPKWWKDQWKVKETSQTNNGPGGANDLPPR